uniref:Uncharacterized protein n=1 Tax=Lygus hesperus TaxID=30085 RepID=A0A146L6K0_LYGHE
MRFMCYRQFVTAALAVTCVLCCCILSLVDAATSVSAGKKSKAKKKYVAPNLQHDTTALDDQYLIGVISFFFVTVAGVLAIRSLMVINYDDDTLLMVEVP